jgi:hypothetical protein
MNKPTRDLEECIKCGNHTERSGKSDDSLYADIEGEEIGPLCEKCLDAILRSVVM